MKCIHCQKEFQIETSPDNAFVGVLRGPDGKAMADEVVLCKKCYYFSLLGLTGIEPWIYSYPLAKRAQHIPPEVPVPLNGLRAPSTKGATDGSHEEKSIREAYAQALDIDIDEIPELYWRKPQVLD